MAIRKLKNGDVKYSGKDALKFQNEYRNARVTSWQTVELLYFEFKNPKQK